MLDGRLVVDGDGEKTPTYEVDRDAERELHEMPEGVAIHSLEAALVAARVDPGLIPHYYWASWSVTYVQGLSNYYGH